MEIVITTGHLSQTIELTQDLAGNSDLAAIRQEDQTEVQPIRRHQEVLKTEAIHQVAALEVAQEQQGRAVVADQEEVIKKRAK